MRSLLKFRDSSLWQHQRALLAAIIVYQVVTLQFWFPLSAHSGQTTIPWMMNEGRVLFGTILEQHAPATSLIAAAAQRLLPFWSPLTVDKLLNTLLFTGLTLLVYGVTRCVEDNPRAAVLSALFWAALGPVYGNVLFYFNTLLGGCIMLALLIWYAGDAKSNALIPIGVGLALGAATLAKQQGWAALVLFGLWIAFTTRSRKVTLQFAAAGLLCPVLLLGVVLLQGNGQHYVYWNWQFNFAGYMEGLSPTREFFRKLLLTNVLVIPFGLLVWRQGRRRDYILLLMAAAALLPLYPRPVESAAVTHIPLAAVMSGIVLDGVWREMTRSAFPGRIEWITLVVMGGVMLSWAVMAAAMAVPSSLGAGKTPDWDEFEEIAAYLRANAQAGDTLVVLPETDSTPQIHPQAGMLPPRTWIKSWRWYLEVPGVVDDLLAEWADQPPTVVVVFPDLIAQGQPFNAPLLDFVDQHYEPVTEFEDIALHGPAVVYRRLP